jgi:hypothetical protein
VGALLETKWIRVCNKLLVKLGGRSFLASFLASYTNAFVVMVYIVKVSTVIQFIGRGMVTTGIGAN